MIVSLDEDGLKLGSPPKPVPGFCVSASVGSKLVFDTATTEGTNGQKYQLKGWEDGDISISIRIIGDEKETMTDKLAKVVALFKKTDSKGVPIIYIIDLPIVRAWRITRTFFSGLQTDQQIGKQEYTAALKFREYKPEVDAVQKSKQTQGENTKESTTPELTPVYTSTDVQDLKRLENKLRNRGL